MNKEANFKLILDTIRKNQSEMMGVGAFKTGVVPDDIVDEHLSRLPDNAMNVLCVSDYGEYVSHLKHKYGDGCNVYCLPSTLYGYNMCIQALSIYEKNPENFVIFNKEKYLSFDKDKYFEDIMKDREMLYDCAVGNPPYSKNLHLKIIDVVLSHLTENGIAVFIHPCKWITDPYHMYYNDSVQNEFLDKYVGHIKSLEEINTDTFNRLFGTQNRFGVGIITYTNDIENKFNKHSFEDDMDSVMCNILMYKKKSFRSQFVRKGEETTEYFTPVRRTNHGYLEWCGGEAKEGIQFNSKNELDNFIKSTFKWPYVWLNKYGNENSADMPYLDDYTKEWTDEMLFDYFHINESDQKRIKDEIRESDK